jgi:hypothetical protein
VFGESERELRGLAGIELELLQIVSFVISCLHTKSADLGEQVFNPKGTAWHMHRDMNML